MAREFLGMRAEKHYTQNIEVVNKKNSFIFSQKDRK